MTSPCSGKATGRGSGAIQRKREKKKAVKQAGLEDFREHDLRHTWASGHAQAGTPSNALQEMGGWESAEMVLRCAHLAAEHLL